MCKLKKPLGGVLRKKVLLKFEKLRLLGFYHSTYRGWYANFVKPLKILVKELIFNKLSALQPANAIKIKFLVNSF